MTTHDPQMMELADRVTPSRTGRSRMSAEPPRTAGPALVLCENLVKIYKVADLEVVALQGLDRMAVESGETDGHHRQQRQREEPRC